MQCIGLMKSADGTNFTTPQIAVQLPQDVYPLNDNYWGLSTPSALAINDTIYLFTDVARTINGEWTQVALHQFKTIANSGVWYHDTLPIHTMQDFVWTDGDYLSNLLAPTPLLDDNGLLRVWYAGYRLADVNGADTTYNVYFDSLGIMHINPDFWGIGTSSYQFPLVTKMNDRNKENQFLTCYPNPALQLVTINMNQPILQGKISIFDNMGRSVFNEHIQAGNSFTFDISILTPGLYYVEVLASEMKFYKKLVVGEKYTF